MSNLFHVKFLWESCSVKKWICLNFGINSKNLIFNAFKYFRYIESHKELQLDQGPNYKFLGHPINAYHFIRHVASGWQEVQNHITGENQLHDDLLKLKEREKEKLPDKYDVEGGAFGLVRLKSLYNYDMESFINDGVISATLDNGQVVKSDPSVLKLNSE